MTKMSHADHSIAVTMNPFPSIATTVRPRCTESGSAATSILAAAMRLPCSMLTRFAITGISASATAFMCLGAVVTIACSAISSPTKISTGTTTDSGSQPISAPMTPVAAPTPMKSPVASV